MRKQVQAIVRGAAKSSNDVEVAKAIKLFSDIAECEAATESERRVAGEMVGVYAIELGMRTAEAAKGDGN
jgi:hypothetical protein